MICVPTSQKTEQKMITKRQIQEYINIEAMVHFTEPNYIQGLNY